MKKLSQLFTLRELLFWGCSMGAISGCVLHEPENDDSSIRTPVGTVKIEVEKAPPYAIRPGTVLVYQFTSGEGRAQYVWERETVWVSIRVVEMNALLTSDSLEKKIFTAVEFRGSNLSFARYTEDPGPPDITQISGLAHCTTYVSKSSAPRATCSLDSRPAGVDSVPEFLTRSLFRPVGLPGSAVKGEMRYMGRSCPLMANILGSGSGGYYEGTVFSPEIGAVYHQYYLGLGFNVPDWSERDIQLKTIDGSTVDGPAISPFPGS